MPREDYEERKQARIDRLQERAQAKAQQANQEWETSSKMASVIPFGQPILVGHHSEKRDRNYRARIENKMRKSAELSSYSKHLALRAEAAESNTAISSDDPEAVTKLKANLADEQAIHDANKNANKLLRKAKIKVDELSEQRLIDAGIDDARIRRHLIQLRRINCMYGEYVKLPSYELSNRNANMKRMKDRIKELEAQAQLEDKTIEHEGFEIVHNTDENRVQLIFPGKPSEAIRTILKSHGFRWSRYNGAWQRLLNGNGIYAANSAAKQIEEL